MKKTFYSIFIVLFSIININAQSWLPVGGGTNDPIGSMCVFNNELYVGGNFISAGGIAANGCAKWNGSNWAAVNSPGNQIQCMIVYNNELYEGGSMGFSKFDGINWIPLDSNGLFGHVEHLEIFNNKLYVSGSPGYICEWNGSTLNIIGFASASVLGLRGFNSELYVTGYFNNINGVPASGIAKWNGSTWSALGNGILGGTAGSMEVFNNELYVGGGFNASAGNADDYLMKWTGTSWLPVGANFSGGISGLTGVGEIKLINGNLYVGGNFTSVHGFGANQIAYTNNNTWYPMGAGLNSYVYQVIAFQNSIYAAGYFTTSGSNLTLHIAKWDTPTEIDQIIKPINNIYFSPNPFNIETVLKSDFGLQNTTLSIYNQLGQQIKRIALTNDNQTKIERGHLSNGLYTYQLTQENKIIQVGKLVITD
ncbi:MAG: T9SS type A sorting domain-containing protein [Bacteroidetes bacterium]|jgi:hypothetical protein|nr:T9SS type A sorting domain-containing protein [Bacteroidota bacterium]